MEFCFKLGFSFLLIWFFLFIPYQIANDFNPQLLIKNQLLVWKYRLVMNVFGFLSAIFMLLGGILAIWS